MHELINLFNNTWDAASSLSSNQAFSNVLSALLGALFGSLSGYWFNRKLEKNRTNERYLIQRKNTIYSPVYKQLLALRRYLQSIDKYKNKSTDIKLNEERYYGRRIFPFHIWTDINQDIRKVYISSKQRGAMDALIKRIEDHESNEANVDIRIENIRQKFVEKYSSKLNNPDKFSGLSYGFKSDLRAFIFPTEKGKDLRQSLIKDITNEYSFSDITAGKKVDILISELKVEDTIVVINDSFKALIHATDEAISVFESTISDIVNKYEGGV